ncbi:hypothetical protein BD769DRAFT_1626072 [Suillus cothurnatus]|nr:hypothetical protein BD769DRAFT_1626072 [Suillus cothurnatus]
MSGPYVYTQPIYEPPPYYTHPYTPQRSPFIPPLNLFPPSPSSPYAELPGTPHTSYYPDGYRRRRPPSWHGGMPAAPPSPSFWGFHWRRATPGGIHSAMATASPQHFQIHPLLNGEAYGSEFYFDIANPAFAPLRRVGPNHTTMVSVEELREPATFPTITRMRITHDAIPQWPIDLELVHGEYDISGALPITVGDKTAIARAYTRRYRSIPSSAQLEASQGVKRIDYLMDRHVFRGLVRAPDEDGVSHWRLLT